MDTHMHTYKLPAIALSLSLLIGGGVAHAACSPNTIAPNTPDIRYTDNGDGTVTDKLTKLVWMQCVIGKSGEDCTTGSEQRLNWKQALQNQVLLNADGGFANHTDWRLPNRKELTSIINNQCTSPAINSTLFPNQPLSIAHWSSTPDTSDETRSWAVNFQYGDVSRDRRTDVRLLRLVRDAN